MKRAATTNQENCSKRPKVSTSDPFHPSLKRKVFDVCERGSDGSGYISGKAFMTWPVKQKERFNVETVENSRKYRFDVEFSGACSPHFNKLEVHPQDAIQIALKGVSIEKMKKSSGPDSLPMALKYHDGVIIKFVRRSRKPSENGLIVDTWQENIQPQHFPEDEWFSTPINEPRDSFVSLKIDKISSIDPHPEPRDTLFQPNLPPISSLNSELSVSDPSAPQSAKSKPSEPLPLKTLPPDDAVVLQAHSEIPSDKKLSAIVPSSKAISSRQPNDALDTQNFLSAVVPSSTAMSSRQPDDLLNIQPIVPVLTKKQAKKLKKQRRAQKAALKASTSTSSSSHDLTKNGVPDAKDTGKETDGPPTLCEGGKLPVPSNTNAIESTSITLPSTTSPAPNVIRDNADDLDPALKVESGCRSENGDVYTPLGSLGTNKLYNVIGLVTSIDQPRKTNTNEWCRSFSLIDPSNYDVSQYGFPEDRGFKVNCFTATYQQWLPSPKYGEVLILKAVKTSNWNGGLSGVGYKDKLRWAVFDPDASTVHHGDVGDAPQSEGLGGGFGYIFSPFWKPTNHELAYCSKIADWWRAVLKFKEKQMGNVHHIPENLTTRRSPHRIHRLISEASPDIPPNGFFDCTVEVLYGYQNDNEVYSLYVTDYTSNSQIPPVQASWCPPGLADRVLKIEMWPPADELAKNMHTGDYYSLRNARMKLSSGGFLEGTFSEVVKARKLDETHAANELHLQALLQRKKDWERSGANVSSTFEHCLFKDVQKEVFFNCTVEILYVSHNNDGTTDLYVTDYTSHLDLPPVPAAAWSRGLEGRIVTISLWNRQIEMAKLVEPGSYYSILKLRLKRSTTGRAWQGRLGGDERLIHKLKSQNTTNKELIALIRRKREWQRTIKENVSVRQQTHTGEGSKPIRTALLGSLNRHDYNTIHEILAHEKCPNNFRLMARVVDFYPLRLETCVALRCTNCQEDIPVIRKACAQCNDVERAHVSYLYRFFFCLEDEVGARLRISVSNEECTLLQGLKPVDLQADAAAAKMLSDRLKPLIGNLVEVHHGILRNERVAPDTPLLELTIESWVVPTDEQKPLRAYGLVDHRIIIGE